MSEQYHKDNLGFEIDKLSKQLKLLNELDLLWEKQAKYKSNAVKSMEIHTKIMETQRKLEAQGIKNIQTQADLNEKAEEIDRLRNIKWDERLRIEDALIKKQEQEVINQEKLRQKEEERNRQKEESRRKEARAEADRYRNQTEVMKLQERLAGMEEEILLASKETTVEKRRQQIENDKEIQQLRKQLQLEEQKEKKQNKSKDSIAKSKDSIKIPGVGTVGQIKEFSELSIGAQLISVAADTFNEAVDKFGRLFLQGIDNISGKANSQFQNISVRTGMSYGRYRSDIASLGRPGGRLSNYNGLDLYDNIKVSDVQDMMNSLANSGMGEAELLTNSLETVLTKNIVPYLTNLEDSSMQQLNAVTNGEMMRQVRGIAKVNNELYEDNTVATKYLQQQLDYLAPMASVAGIQLIQNDEQMLTYYQGLRKQGMSDYMIGQNINSLNKMRYNQQGTLKNGTPLEKMTMINSYINDVNPLLDGVGFANQYEGTAAKFGSMTPNDGGLLTSIAGNAWGFSDDRYSYYYANANLDLDKAYSNAKKSNYGKAGDAAAQLFASGANQTAQQKQEATLENLSTEIALWKVDTGVWFDVLTTAVQGIAKILLGLIAGKGIGSLLHLGSAGGGISGLGTYLNAGLQQGFMTGSTTAPLAGKLGFMSSTGGAIAGAAGIAAGGAMAVKGGMDVYNDFKNNDVSGKTALSATGAVGGAVGAGALIALGASNPIGWVALAVGGLALAGRAAIEYSEGLAYSEENFRKNAEHIRARYDAMSDALREETENTQASLQSIKESLEDNADLEVVRAQLINSGILSEEDTEKARNLNRKGLEQLTEAYIIAAGNFNGEAEALINKYKEAETNTFGSAVQDLNNWWEKNKNYQKGNANYDEMKFLVDTVVADLRGRDNLTKKQQDVLNEYDKASKDGFTRHELEQILDGPLKNGAQFTELQLSKKAMSKIKNSGKYYGENVKNYKEYNESAVQLMGLAYQYQYDKDKVLEYLKELKYTHGITEEHKVYGGDIKDIQNKAGIEAGSYRTGLDSVPYDNYPAMLHEGEAVLTAGTANELRNLLDEYRATRNDSIKITQAIEEQTSILVEKLDAIYTKMPSSEEVSAQEIMPGRLNQNIRKMTTPYNAHS